MSDPKFGHNPGTVSGQASKTKEAKARARVVQTSARPPKAPPLPRRLYDIQAVAAYLGISHWTVREMIWRGDLPYVKIGRRQYLDIRDVDGFIEANKEREH